VITVETVDLRVRLALLWILMAVAGSIAVLLSMMEEGFIEDVIAGGIEGMTPTAWTYAMGIPFFLLLLMAFLSVTLKDSINRRVNIIAGLGFTVLLTMTELERLAGGHMGGDRLFGIPVIVGAILIVWYAWKWPKPRV